MATLEPDGWRLSYCVANREWEKTFMSKDLLVDELRKHICGDCLEGNRDWLNDVVDTPEFECRDMGTLLSTPCGLEYEVEEPE